MKIVAHTPNCLQLRSAAPEWALLMLGMGVVLIGVSIVQPGIELSGQEGQGAELLNRLLSALARALFLIPGSVAIFAGIWLVELFATYSFERTSGRLWICRRYILHQTAIYYDLWRIRAATATVVEDSEGDRRATIQLELDTGRQVRISNITETRDPAEYEPLAAAIRDFLGVPATLDDARQGS